MAIMEQKERERGLEEEAEHLAELEAGNRRQLHGQLNKGGSCNANGTPEQRGKTASQRTQRACSLRSVLASAS